MGYLRLINTDTIADIVEFRSLARLQQQYNTTLSLSTVDVKTTLVHYGMMGTNQTQMEGSVAIVSNN